MEGFIGEALALLLRWLHVVAAIAWIGESFYFVMIDRSLRAPRSGAPGVAGELWSVHGGGFYHLQKYATAPGGLPEHLHWSMWKSYTTWLSGFALFAIIYLASPSVWLVDPRVAELAPGTAVALAIGFLVGGYVVYDLACRALGFRERALALVVALGVVALCWATTQLFAGRAAFLIAGATLATIMSANVFFVIIPGQRRMVAALSRGETPDPLPGRRGRQRSVHNTYFTLPVVFAMLSIHYAPAWSHPASWAILALFMAAGAVIRQFFVLWHSGRRAYGLLALGATLIVAAFAWLAPREASDDAPATRSHGSAATIPTGPVASADLMPLIVRHCHACHASKPTLLPSAPNGVAFDTPEQLERAAVLVHQQVVVTRAMPPGNMTGMTEDERAMVGRWFEGRER